MTYFGSKARLVKDICPIINSYIKENNIKNFYDVFCGSANLTDKIECENIYASDLSPTLIALHIQAQKDFSQIPTSQTREKFNLARDEYKIILKNLSNKKILEDYQNLISMPLYEMGAYEWYCTFSARGFSGGYGVEARGRDLFQERRKNHEKQAKEEKYQKINFSQGSYTDIKIPPNSLIYCDSPYKGTKPYQINPHFNHAKYYEWLKEKSKTNPIFISEEWMPEDFNSIWEKEAKRTGGASAIHHTTEHLYFIDNRQI